MNAAASVRNELSQHLSIKQRRQTVQADLQSLEQICVQLFPFRPHGRPNSCGTPKPSPT